MTVRKSSANRSLLSILNTKTASGAPHAAIKTIKNRIHHNPIYMNFKLFEYHAKIHNERVLISYKGPVTYVILSEISNEIKSIFASEPKMSKKVFSAFIELAENVHNYSSEQNTINGKTSKVGMIAVVEMPDSYILMTGNLIDDKNLLPLLEKCEKINSLDRESLRQLKRDEVEKSIAAGKAGGGIGLIKVALATDLPLQIEYTPTEEGISFFSISVTFSK
jgi:hypothetical protein